jgi:hypothetical protein
LGLLPFRRTYPTPPHPPHPSMRRTSKFYSKFY